MNKLTAHTVGGGRGSTSFFFSPYYFLEVSMHEEGPATQLFLILFVPCTLFQPLTHLQGTVQDAIHILVLKLVRASAPSYHLQELQNK